MVTKAKFSDDMREAARLWAIRVRDPAFTDWDGFTVWLEADPAHADAYDSALDDAEWADQLLVPSPAALLQPAPRFADMPASRRGVLRYGGGAIAASLAVLAGFGGWMALRDAPREIVTGIGERRVIALVDGSRATLNGGTRLRLDPDNPRQIEMTGGEAIFEIKHDSANPFVILTGTTRLVDAGTVFNVVERQGALDVAVAEGVVIYDTADHKVRLDAGKALSRASANAAPVVRTAELEAIGSWRLGYLQYTAAPIGQVAVDLSRNIGMPVEIGESAGSLPFSGTLMLNGSPGEVMERAGPLLGVRFVREGQTWRAMPIDGVPR